MNRFLRKSFVPLRRRAALGLLAAILLMPGRLCPVSFASGFGDNWPARPLIDTTTTRLASPTSAVMGNQPPRPSAAEQEARLAPYEPFIHEVETALAIVPPVGQPRVDRLNAIQHIVFAGQPYRGDAGELLRQLQTVFPQQAARASALMAQQQTLASNQTSGYPDASQAKASGTNPKAPKQKKHAGSKLRSFFSQSMYGDDPFANDPFFQDSGFSALRASAAHSTAGMNSLALGSGSMSNYSTSGSGFGAPSYSSNAVSYSVPSTYSTVPNGAASPNPPSMETATYDNNAVVPGSPNANYPQAGQATYANPPSGAPNGGPSRMTAIGQSLGSLAMMAGGLAAGYYLNKKSGNYPNQALPYGYYNNPYGMAPYGASPYGLPYPVYGAQGYGNPYGAVPYYAPGYGYGSSGINGLYNGVLGNAYGIAAPMISTPARLPFGMFQSSMLQNSPYTYHSPY